MFRVEGFGFERVGRPVRRDEDADAPEYDDEGQSGGALHHHLYQNTSKFTLFRTRVEGFRHNLPRSLNHHTGGLHGNLDPKPVMPQRGYKSCKLFWPQRMVTKGATYRDTSLIRNTHPLRITIGP